MCFCYHRLLQTCDYMTLLCFSEITISWVFLKCACRWNWLSACGGRWAHNGDYDAENWRNRPIPVVERVSAAARLLGLRVLVPSEAWMSVFVSVMCCHVEVSATGWSLVQRSSTTVVCYCVWSRNLKHEAALARVGLLSHRGNWRNIVWSSGQGWAGTECDSVTYDVQLCTGWRSFEFCNTTKYFDQLFRDRTLYGELLICITCLFVGDILYLLYSSPCVNLDNYRSTLTVKCTLFIFNLTFILSSTQHVSAFASHHQV
jgi:hypothetical protein